MCRDGCRDSVVKTGASLKGVVLSLSPCPQPLALSCQRHHPCGHTAGWNWEATQLKASNSEVNGYQPGWSTNPVLHIASQNSVITMGSHEDERPSMVAGTVPSLLEQPRLQLMKQLVSCNWVKLLFRSGVPASPTLDKASTAEPEACANLLLSKSF